MALHELQHDLDRQPYAEGERPATPHDDGNCPIHSMLHSPVVSTAIAQPALGLTESAEKTLPANQSVVLADFAPNLSCRGPPRF